MMNADQAKAVANAMTALWLREHPATVRVLSAVSDDRREYRPHERSRSAWELATHIATADVWFIESILRGEFRFDPDAAKRATEQFRDIADVAAFHEATVPAALRRLDALSGDELAQPLDFFGRINMSRAEWIGFAGNHSVHHRGQLSAYLRAMGCRVPDIYGPSGDAELPPAR